MATRRMRAFKRWMKANGIEFSDALQFTDDPQLGISVKALCDLKEGDVVATIPKHTCLTIKTSGACDIIEEAGLHGSLGLSFAIMYERSLKEESPWSGYLQILPEQECLPLVWTLDEVDQLLCGTELHKTVKGDKALVYEDWEENILPLLELAPLKLNPNFFGVEQYFAAKTLVASRAFQIDDSQMAGMVPLADLFNHNTRAEDVHFTYDHESDDDGDSNLSGIDDCKYDEDRSAINSLSDKKLTCEVGENESGANEDSSATMDDQKSLEMIMVKDVSAGAEVFNTYGIMGNAALLHRYGFTEQDNSFSIVNIDLDLVLEWSSSMFSNRHSRARLSLWRKVGYFPRDNIDSEYFEISPDGEPEIELLLLLYIMLLPDDTFHMLDLSISTNQNPMKPGAASLLEIVSIFKEKTSEISKEPLLTRDVCDALVSLANLRDSLYCSNSIEDDISTLKRCSSVGDRKLYHSVVLRISERRILQKLRSFAALHGGKSFVNPKRNKRRRS